ncbi:hypothetical protein WA026_016178 [Henosepilachna vigintioctopunctata]|uniref:carbonic anhydrase n=1 Tax=Henosepilachna vigintioctopunctata TaxID=420089 RepID=A0AAW1TL88_9CUCU
MNCNPVNVLFALITISNCQAWDYRNQDLWPSVYCRKAVAQSPIDLQNDSAIQLKMATPLVFINWDQDFNVSMRNTGYTILVDFLSNDISVSGGKLPGIYKVVQFHFHWGSEHTINGQRQALEVHFVGFNNKYYSLEEALEYHNGLAVITVMYDYSDKDNEMLQPIVQQIDKIIKYKQMADITINPLTLLPKNVMNFYRYQGSLTTPNCNDVVVWTIFDEIEKVSEKQIEAFRSILSTTGTPLTENFRNLKPLNGRSVYKILA